MRAPRATVGHTRNPAGTTGVGSAGIGGTTTRGPRARRPSAEAAGARPVRPLGRRSASCLAHVAAVPCQVSAQVGAAGVPQLRARGPTGTGGGARRQEQRGRGVPSPRPPRSPPRAAALPNPAARVASANLAGPPPSTGEEGAAGYKGAGREKEAPISPYLKSGGKTMAVTRRAIWKFVRRLG